MDQKEKDLHRRCVMTVAVGSDYYRQLALNLYRSFLYWNKYNQIHFILITDNTDSFKLLPEEQGRISLLTHSNPDLTGFSSKFVLIDQAAGIENLFIDCDCLVYRDLTEVFDKFNLTDFGVVGSMIHDGEFFCSVKDVLSRFKLRALPKFVGSVYFFRANEAAEKIFKTAKELKERYDELGFIRLRGKENEEPLFSLAMALDGINPIYNDGSVKADLMYYHNVRCNVQNGHTCLQEPELEKSGGEYLPSISTPAILHFNNSFTESALYHGEIFRLKNIKNHQSWNTLLVFLRYELVSNTKNSLKSLLRPIYRSLFGSRRIKKLKRAS